MIREAGWVLDCVSKRHGGEQRIDMNGTIFPMEYDATNYKMYLACRAPTELELSQLHILWLECHLDDVDIDEGLKPIRRDKSHLQESKLIMPTAADVPLELEDTRKDKSNAGILKAPFLQKEYVGSEEHAQSDISPHTSTQSDLSTINWKLTLGYCPDNVVESTLKNTTQYYTKPTESETKAYPTQHRQKRLHALHLRRLPGRTCGDTFFSSIRSIRGYTCVQLFVASFADYLWVSLLRRESQVPGAYQDFCREVGCPNELLTDNSKVQSGEKFKKINRENLTNHVFSTPHCQNQNLAERKIQDVKHRSVLILYESKAPLLFWCYAVEFVTNCLNHTSREKLDNLQLRKF